MGATLKVQQRWVNLTHLVGAAHELAGRVLGQVGPKLKVDGGG